MNQLRRARQCLWTDHSRQGRLRRWGGRSRHTCSRIRRYRTGQGSHGRNRGESGTASGNEARAAHPWRNSSDCSGQTRYPSQPHPVIARCLSDRPAGLKKESRPPYFTLHYSPLLGWVGWHTLRLFMPNKEHIADVWYRLPDQMV